MINIFQGFNYTRFCPIVKLLTHWRETFLIQNSFLWADIGMDKKLKGQKETIL